MNFDEPIVKLVKVGGIDQPVQYEGISYLAFHIVMLDTKQKVAHIEQGYRKKQSRSQTPLGLGF